MSVFTDLLFYGPHAILPMKDRLPMTTNSAYKGVPKNSSISSFVINGMTRGTFSPEVSGLRPQRDECKAMSERMGRWVDESIMT